MTRWHIEPEDEEYEEDETDEWCGNPIQHLNPEVGDEDDDPEQDDGPAFVPAAKAYETADGDIRALRRMPYSRYLETLHWRITRRRALLRAGYRCKQREATKASLEVHHLSIRPARRRSGIGPLDLDGCSAAPATRPNTPTRTEMRSWYRGKWRSTPTPSLIWSPACYVANMWAVGTAKGAAIQSSDRTARAAIAAAATCGPRRSLRPRPHHDPPTALVR